MTVSDRGHVLALVAEAVEHGARQHTACEMVGVDERTLQQWQLPKTAEDGRRGPRTAPHNKLSRGERETIVAMAARPECCTRILNPDGDLVEEPLGEGFEIHVGGIQILVILVPGFGADIACRYRDGLDACVHGRLAPHQSRTHGR